MTARRMMHMLYPSTLDYKMQHLGTPMDRDKGVMECFKWAPDENAVIEASDFYRPSVMFFVQPPWMLSSKDMDVFVRTQKVGGVSARPRSCPVENFICVVPESVGQGPDPHASSRATMVEGVRWMHAEPRALFRADDVPGVGVRSVLQGLVSGSSVDHG